jgi:hypothetical protein
VSIDTTSGRLISVSTGAVLDDTLWIHGGYVGYDNGTQQSEPSRPKHLWIGGRLCLNSDIQPDTYLRAIDLTQSFSLASRDEAPVKYLLQPDSVPEISAGTMWGYQGKLYELAGEPETVDEVCAPCE